MESSIERREACIGSLCGLILKLEKGGESTDT